MPQRQFIRSLIAATILCLDVAIPARAGAAEPAAAAAMLATTAEEALIVDGETGAILYEKNARKPFPPASLAKLMTMEVVFEAIRSGKLTLDQEFKVTEHAWRTGGAPSGTSTMFAKVNSMVPLGALIRGAIVQAANDACIAIAEGMAGSEAAFAKLMNQRAVEIGLTDSVFVNPTGLPAEGQQVTVRDLVLLARHIRTTYPELYKIYSEPSFEWNNIFQRNRNPLLSLDQGATGMGTGYTEASGYALLGVTEAGPRLTYLAMSGLPSLKDRTDESRRLMAWAATSFRRAQLFRPGDRVGSAEIFGGAANGVGLVVQDPIVAYIPTDAPQSVSAHIQYDEPLQAPVAAGEQVGTLVLRIGGLASVSRPLYAAEAVPQGSFSDRALDAVGELAFGWLKTL
ncbi:D-alanyl-D-alanine carboxypeptidase [Aurantimonas sp. MSK8Z-1]|uniref:D-alanyl-D-alanine carboxypeptidase family protein n=1 Tax=Mangrovibrevibacter kandeliae TaxID=2968473 RepID=UPI00211758F2|nr:D-alanyl-D-alanine carboxypeptidase family protein [Aurantimonas sp. MSK8Z-1]MCW4114570.1 D-alanyl-D-alanine carboxypeptidase [Aurantimonas sp. MSK8Z-1]